MNLRTGQLISVVLLCACVVVYIPACNVDGMWADRQGPRGPVMALSAHGAGESSEEAVDITIADAQEVDLVEAVLHHRGQYYRNLRQLRAFYEERGYATKEQWAAFELQGLTKIKPFRYLMSAEIPSDKLRPEQNIEEANALYEKGLDMMKRGGHGIPALYRQDLMSESAEVFRDLIERYPTSDKIDEAAYYCGEIHKEYLPGQETIAVKWYERAWTWNPGTALPARFQAAVVYDYRLHDRDRALELYHGVVQHETDHKSNVRFASRRIHELTASNEVTGAVVR